MKTKSNGETAQRRAISSSKPTCDSKKEQTSDAESNPGYSRKEYRRTPPVEQEILHEDWERFNPKEKAIRRAQRSRRGEKCSECGCVGYFRRNCPTCPPVRYDARTGSWRAFSAEDIQEKNSRCWPIYAMPPTGTGSKPTVKKNNAREMDGSFHRTAGRGFLWGPLADGASKALNVAEKMYSKGNIPRAGSVASVAGMNVEMPSLSSTSDLPSGVIPGIRKALMWTDEEGGWTSPTIFSSINGVARRQGQGGLPLDLTHPAKISLLKEPNDVVGTRASWEGLDGSAQRYAGTGGRVESSDFYDKEQHNLMPGLTWRWPELCSMASGETRASTSPIHESEHTHTGPLGAGPASKISSPVVGLSRQESGGHDHDWRGSRGNEAGSQDELFGVIQADPSSYELPIGEFSGAPFLPLKGSYLRLRNKTVCTVQESLHLAMARLAEAIRKQASSVVSKPSSAELLQNPLEGTLPERYYGAATRKDFCDFFDAEEEEASRRQQPKAHSYLGSLREGGEAKYTFDRTSHTRRKALIAHLRGDFTPQPEGYRGTTVHSVVAWRRLNTTLDRVALVLTRLKRGPSSPLCDFAYDANFRYASSERDAIKRVAHSKKALKLQAMWVEEQSKAREQRRQRANHLLEVFRSELLSEQKREIGVLRLPSREQHFHVTNAMKDRTLAADRIMRNIKRYGLMGNMEDAHYVMYALAAARRAGLAPEGHLASRQLPSANIDTTATTLGKGERSSPPDQAVAKQQGNFRNEGGGDTRGGADDNVKMSGPSKGNHLPDIEDDANDEISPYARPLTRPFAAAPKVTPKTLTARKRRSVTRAARDRRFIEDETVNVAAQEARRRSIQSERLRTFRLVGHPVRRGREDDTTKVPALIPIPQGFGSGKISQGEQKSYAAGKIMDALRASQVDPITGRAAKIAVPLWHRATEEIDSSNTGSIIYSDLIGHTYSVLVGPRRVATSDGV